MKKIIYFIVVFIIYTNTYAQEAFQFSGLDCNGDPVDLYAELDAGKAAILFYYMPDCGACPPPASEIQEMAYNIMNEFPEMVKGYAFPFLDTYDCASVQTWVDESHVPFFAPMDSGEYQVAYYGGFGMPTVVLVGGSDHRILFSTLSFFDSDTTIMRDSILRLFGVETEVEPVLDQISDFIVSPNPAAWEVMIDIQTSVALDYTLSLFHINGTLIQALSNNLNAQAVKQEIFDVEDLPNGMYIVKLRSGPTEISRSLIISH